MGFLARRAGSGSIDDVAGCAVTGGLEDWKVQQLPRVMLSRSDLPGGAVKMCFASAELRDAFHAALSNLAAGKPW